MSSILFLALIRLVSCQEIRGATAVETWEELDREPEETWSAAGKETQAEGGRARKCKLTRPGDKSSSFNPLPESPDEDNKRSGLIMLPTLCERLLVSALPFLL